MNILSESYLNFSLFTGINTFSHTPPKEWFQTSAVLRVSLGNFLFFVTFALMMIGVKDQNDRRDSWHHGGWIVKIVIWAVLIVLMFFLPNEIITIYGEFSLVLVTLMWISVRLIIFLMHLYYVIHTKFYFLTSRVYPLYVDWNKLFVL